MRSPLISGIISCWFQSVSKLVDPGSNVKITARGSSASHPKYRSRGLANVRFVSYLTGSRSEREISVGMKANFNIEKPKVAQMRAPTSAALIINNGSRSSCNRNQVKSVYCCGSRFSASCNRVSDWQDRIEVLKIERSKMFCLFKTW